MGIDKEGGKEGEQRVGKVGEDDEDQSETDALVMGGDYKTSGWYWSGYDAGCRQVAFIFLLNPIGVWFVLIR